MYQRRGVKDTNEKIEATTSLPWTSSNIGEKPVLPYWIGPHPAEAGAVNQSTKTQLTRAKEMFNPTRVCLETRELLWSDFGFE